MQDPGEMATMPKQRRDKMHLQRPDRFGDVVHFDIVYGSGKAIGSYRCALWFVDRCYKNIKQYPLMSLSSDELLKALRKFCRNMGGRYPNNMIGDRDFKIIGGQVPVSLEGINKDREDKDKSVVAGAPIVRKIQNGLPEIKWRHVMNMVCNSLTRN